MSVDASMAGISILAGFIVIAAIQEAGIVVMDCGLSEDGGL
ncbi:MAG: hypothetical protein U9N43_08425 [Euryarchaeota archaeon]|nr:hypothetical protein [Euryarchaeota archaeon]